MNCPFCGSHMHQRSNKAKHVKGSVPYHVIHYECGPSPRYRNKPSKTPFCGCVLTFDLQYKNTLIPSELGYIGRGHRIVLANQTNPRCSYDGLEL